MVPHQRHRQPLAANVEPAPSTHYYYADQPRVVQPSHSVQQPAYMVQQQPLYVVQQQPMYAVQPGLLVQQPAYMAQQPGCMAQPSCAVQGLPITVAQPVASPEMVPPQQAGDEEVPMGKAVC